MLAYADFDGTEPGRRREARTGEAAPTQSLHQYAPHVADWQTGDPTWKGGMGKGLIGALNYLGSKGLVSFSYGSRAYPVEYTYDDRGRMKTMKTWQSYIGNSGAATTTWTYNDYRNWLAKKQDNASKGPEYEYTPGGKLKTRKWARNITTTYNYGTAANGNKGDLVSIDYSDTTPDVTYT